MRLTVWLWVLGTALAAAPPPKLQGVWEASVVTGGREVAFRLEIRGEGPTLAVAILDGGTRIESTSATFGGGRLKAKWDYYDATLDVAMEGGELRGQYRRLTRKGPVNMAVFARPFEAAKTPAEGAADFSGEWVIQTDGTGPGSVWTASFRQTGAEVTGTIQAVDGDFGTLSGIVRGRTLKLSHFDAIRATLIEAELRPDGKLTGTVDQGRAFTGRRASAANAEAAADAAQVTRMRNPAEPLRFEAPDLNGQMVSSSRHTGKVLIVTVMGSWCPNCHDEAPFFEELYRKYKGRGLEVVALSFEYTGEVERDREQVRAFNRRHGVTYTTLLAGKTDDGEVQRVLPQLSNFGAFPTSLYVGRDGVVRRIHTGFSGPATGAEFTRLKQDLESLVVQLLDGK